VNIEQRVSVAGSIGIKMGFTLEVQQLRDKGGAYETTIKEFI